MAARATGRLYDRALAPFDLNAMQFAILNNIGRRGAVPTMDLAEMLSLERTTLYRALSVLQRRNLIATEPGHGREQILSLTDSGQSLRKDAGAAWEEVQENFVSAFGSEWEILLGHLRRARVIAEENAD
ncbi:MarR family winged helix-turn-helix transcriptional regulator [Solirhodobacter olei]|uniref:MarR family winged helix-turn-helix transcriptional regulator n=1 Tax=Solirhodobacter olei TaxID=2493082 RepID=UPI0013E2A2EA|nr:MarR family transcriptional regulator [Solirhodobacter olei]